MAMIHSVPKDSTANDMLKGLATAAGAAYIGHLLFNEPSNAAIPMNTPTKQLNNGNYLEKAFWTTAGLFGIKWLYHWIRNSAKTIESKKIQKKATALQNSDTKSKLLDRIESQVNGDKKDELLELKLSPIKAKLTPPSLDIQENGKTKESSQHEVAHESQSSNNHQDINASKEVSSNHPIIVSPNSQQEPKSPSNIPQSASPNQLDNESNNEKQSDALVHSQIENSGKAPQSSIALSDNHSLASHSRPSINGVKIPSSDSLSIVPEKKVKENASNTPKDNVKLESPLFSIDNDQSKKVNEAQNAASPSFGEKHAQKNNYNSELYEEKEMKENEIEDVKKLNSDSNIFEEKSQDANMKHDEHKIFFLPKIAIPNENGVLNFKSVFDNYMENVKNAATHEERQHQKQKLQETAISIIQNFSELKSTSNNVYNTFIYWIDIGRITVDDELLNAAFQSKNPQLLHFLLGYINEETCIQLYDNVKKSESKSLVNMIKFKIDNGLLKPIDNPIMVQFIPLKDVTLCDKLDELTLDEKAECWHHIFRNQDRKKSISDKVMSKEEHLETLFPELIKEYQLYNMLARTLTKCPFYIQQLWIRDYSTDFPIRFIEQLTLAQGTLQNNLLLKEKQFIRSEMANENNSKRLKLALKIIDTWILSNEKDTISYYEFILDNYKENIKYAATDNCKKRVKKELQDTAISIAQRFGELKSTSNNVCKTFIYWIDIGRIAVKTRLLLAAFQSENAQLLHFLLGYNHQNTTRELWTKINSLKHKPKHLVKMVKDKLNNKSLEPIKNPLFVEYIPMEDATLCDHLDELSIDEKAECWHVFNEKKQEEKLKILYPQLMEHYQLNPMLARTFAKKPILMNLDISNEFQKRILEAYKNLRP